MSNFQREKQENDKNTEKILDIDPARELSQPSASRPRPTIRCRPGISCERAVVVCLKYTRLALSCCVTDLLLDIRCASVCRRNSAELLGCDESGKQRSPKSVILYILLFRVYVCVRQCTLFRLYVYVVPFPSVYVIPFIRVRCSVSVSVRYSVYTSTLLRFRQCTLFRLYV